MKEEKKKAASSPVRVRFAPSPTGPLHIGGARTALFNWLFACHHGGKFILRIEDTDKERSEKKYEAMIFEGLGWLGIDWDEGADKGGPYGPYRQTERIATYKKYLETLMANGDAYYCYCTKEDLEAQRQALLEQGLAPRYTGHCRNLEAPPAGKKPEVIRFKVPEVKVDFHDLIRGKVSFDAALFGDIVIAKDLDSPLYNFAVVIDDALMEISHVIRGEEHLSNTPKQILIQRALELSEPVYAHIPLILNSDRSKMSKRFGDVALASYREKGFTAEGIVNFLALLGWHPKDDREVVTKEELVEEFDLDRVQQAGAIFSEEKLEWVNREQMRRMTPEHLAEIAAPFFKAKGIDIADDNVILQRALVASVERAKTLKDLVEESAFYFTMPEYETSLLAWKEMPLPEVSESLQITQAFLEKIPEDDFLIQGKMAEHLPDLVGTRKRGEVLWPLRVALSGKSASPDPLEIMRVLGKEESLRRISAALQKFGAL